MLMAQHGALEKGFQLGADSLHCTLVADILLSAGGPLPKAYQHVLSLARTLDEAVQEGNLTDTRIIKIQASLRQIFQPDQDKDGPPPSPQKKQAAPPSSNNKKDEPPTSSVIRQLSRLISAGLTAMKDADPQNLFFSPVTDAIAPGYSRVITKPMCIGTMEQKVSRNEYKSISDWEQDVKLMYKNCIDYNRGSAGQWFRGEAQRQGKVFREEIYAQARRLYQTEIAKRPIDEPISNKRKPGVDTPAVFPLVASNKKRKKDSQEYLPSMPALASMLLADPFVVRIVVARVLRELRRGVIDGTSLPVAHAIVPSLLQILHLTGWSSHICAVRGKKFFVPDAGLEASDTSENPGGATPFESLRRYLPLLLRLMLESELDSRVALGGDLHDAAHVAPLPLQPLTKESWTGGTQTEVMASLVEGSLVHICQPGNANEASLPVTFPKFALALQHLSVTLKDARAFFICLVYALLKQKSKLKKSTRDAVVDSWLNWLRNDGSDATTMTSAAHECLMLLLNEWSALGNQILPRDMLLKFSANAVAASDTSENKAERKFSQIWNSDSEEFAPVKKQYERMLKHLPATHAQQWREQVGIDLPTETPEETNQDDVEMPASPA
jgi:hypothetical protein